MSLQGVLFPMRKLFENLKLRNLKIEKYYTELIQTLGDLVRLYVGTIGKFSEEMFKS